MTATNAVLRSAVALALASMASVGLAGTFTGPTDASSATLSYATENFGPAAFVTLDQIELPTASDISFTFTAGASGGFLVNPGGQVFMFLRLDNATWASGVTLGAFSVTGVALTPTAVATSTDGSTLMVTLQNNTAGNVTIGSGSHVSFDTTNVHLAPGAALRSAGATVNVTGGLSALVSNVNAATLPTDIDAAAAYSIVRIDNAISSSSANNAAGVKKIAVDAVSQRRNFTASGAAGNPASNLTNQLGFVRFDNLGGTQLQVDAFPLTNDYTKTSPTGRTVTVTVTAGSGSFNAGTASAVFVSNLADCSDVSHAGTLNAARTAVTVSGVDPSGVSHWVCYTVGGTVQINEVKNISVSATLEAPTDVNHPNDKTVAVSGTLSDIVNDGTVIDLRNYVPNSAAAFGFASLVRVINTGTTAGDVFGQFIKTDGTLTTQGTLATALAAGGVVELTPAQIEAVLGAPPAGPNVRLRIIAPTSSMSIQLWMRSNGVWVDVTNAQSNLSNGAQ